MLKKSFKVNTLIYPEEFILEGIKEFSSIAEISYQNEALDISSAQDVDIVFMEFMNYVLYLVVDWK